MSTSHAGDQTPQIAIWFFVGATFLFVAPTLFFPGADLWVRIALIALGLVVLAAGGVQLGREIAQRRDARAARLRDDDPTGTTSAP